jgi:hypothetical protein
MPTRKQRRREQKARRHQYEYVYVDDDGNEVAVDPGELRPQKENGRPETRRRDAAGKRPAAGSGRREIQPPSWRRALKRAALWGPLLVVAMVLLNRNVSPLQWATSAVFLIAFFVPISYFTDSMAYRMYRKRLARGDAATKR